MYEIKRVVPAQNRLGETPIWDPEENALYWVDWGGLPTWRYDPAIGQSTTFPVDLPVTSLARRASGGWIAIAKAPSAPGGPGPAVGSDNRQGRQDRQGGPPVAWRPWRLGA